jgi:hypothetical protein
MDTATDTKLQTLPTLGSPLHGGKFAGITTAADGTHHALILLDDKPSDKLTWRKALNWATKLDADLPSRAEALLLFMNLPGEFERTWHWTNTQYSDGNAWYQTFYYGCQSRNGKSAELRARAVRRLPINPSIL